MLEDISKKLKISDSMKKRLSCLGLAVTIFGSSLSLGFQSKKNLNDAYLTAQSGRLYLVDVINQDNDIYIEDINGKRIDYTFDNDDVAVVGKRGGKTSRGTMHEVMLVDSDNNLIYGFMDGKYLSNRVIDNIRVSESDFNKGSSDNILYKDMNINEDGYSLKNRDFVISGGSFNVGDTSWNEALMVYNNKFIHGYVVNDSVSKENKSNNKNITEKSTDNDNLLSDDVYVVNIENLNVRDIASVTEGKKITYLSKGTIVFVDSDKKFNDGDYDWVYIKFINTKTKKEESGWVAATDYTKEKPVNYLVDSTNPDNLINSEAAVLYDIDSDKIMYQKNDDKELSPASITKILTAHIVNKYGDFNDKITFCNDDINVNGWASQGYASKNDIVRVGNTISVKDAMYISLLRSDNAVTVALARYIEKVTNRKFIDIMNEEAKLMGCTNSHFNNAFGATEIGKHYVTALDMAKIGSYIMKNSPDVVDIMGTRSYVLDYNKEKINHESVLLMPNDLFYNQYVVGCKTGFTKGAGQTMVSLYKYNDKEFVIVTLNGKEKSHKNKDATILFNYAVSEFEKSNGKVKKRV